MFIQPSVYLDRREFEFVSHDVISDVNLFFIDISFRNMHMHKDFELFRIFSGELDIVSKNERHRLHEGDFALFNPRRAHEIRALGGNPVRIMPLQVSPSFWSRFYPQMSSVEFEVIDIGEHLGNQRDRLAYHYFSIANNYFEKESYFELRCASHLNALMELLLSRVPWHYLTKEQKATKKDQNFRLGRIMDHIESNYTNKLLLKDLCELEGISLHYLSRYFTAHFGMSFQDYLTMLRYGHARLLLERTDLKAGDIAISSGFSDIRYLNRAFRQLHGCTPLAYRDSFLQGRPAQSKSTDIRDAQQRFLDEKESLSYLRQWLDANPIT
jgi:AraC-like DNA-binding protein